jgi:hypothetical protein
MLAAVKLCEDAFDKADIEMYDMDDDAPPDTSQTWPLIAGAFFMPGKCALTVRWGWRL